MSKQKTTVEYQPEGVFELPYPHLEADQWSSLGQVMMTQLDMNMSARSALDAELDAGNAAYEMRQYNNGESPYPGAPNLIVPFIATAVEEFSSRIAGTAILPRPYVVRGNDPASQQQAHTVEQLYNNLFDELGFEEAHNTCIHLAGRDGTSIMGVHWKIENIMRTVVVSQPQPDGSIKKVKQKMTMTKYDGVKLSPIELRDFMLIPAHAISIEKADAVCWKQYLGESDLMELVNGDILDADMVEKALSYSKPGGSGDLPYDPQGTDTYNINGLIDVTDNSVSAPEGITMMRGPIEVWQIYSDQYDLDGDGVAEENIFWVHYRSRLLLGYAPFEYLGERPFFEYSPFPRPRRFYGFAIPFRLGGLQSEAEIQHNGRLELLDWVNNPTVVKSKSVRTDNEDQKIGKNSILTIPDGMNAGQAFAFLGPPMIPPDNLAEEQFLKQYADMITGAPQSPGSPNNQPSLGGQISARAAGSIAAINGMQTNTVIRRTRIWMEKIFRYVHMLYKQYGPDQMESVEQTQSGVMKAVIPKETLGMDYTLTIAGNGGPLDKESRRNDIMSIFQTLLPLPLIEGNMERIWALADMFLETFDIPEVTRIIGTMEEAKQLGEQQAQAAAQQAQMQLASQVLSHTKVESNAKPSGIPGGSDGGPPQPVASGPA